MEKAVKNQPPSHVVIVGGGFGGLYAAKALSRRIFVQVCSSVNIGER